MALEKTRPVAVTTIPLWVVSGTPVFLTPRAAAMLSVPSGRVHASVPVLRSYAVMDDQGGPMALYSIPYPRMK